MNQPIRLMLVDDHPVAREGLATMLQVFGDQFQVVAQAASVEEAKTLLPIHAPAVVITDLHFGATHSGNGIDFLEFVRECNASCRCILLTSETADRYVLQAYDAGAHAFLYKDAHARDIARTIETVANGYTQFPQSLNQLLAKRSTAPELTAREAMLMPYLAQGLSAKEIAREINRAEPESHISDRTVEVHKGNIKRKFHLDSSGQLIAFAMNYCREMRLSDTLPGR